MDALRLAGVVGSELEAVSAVVGAITLAMLERNNPVALADDGIDLADASIVAARAAAALVDGLLAGSEAAALVTVGVLVDESFTIDADHGAALQAIAAIQEGLGFVVHLAVDSGEYVAYSINTENKSVSLYTNFPFNSFAMLGGRYYGMAPDGIRELGGTSDDGEAINARFRLAMTDLGTSRMKRMQAAYLGYTASGQLRLKTITVDKNGTKSAHYYRMEAQVAGEPREGRIKIGQGLRSVYWGFALEAIDGAAFMIDLLALHPIVLEQRLQGQNGGR
jgi:hypothetical protein